ncbi:MAG TPA: glutaredoxin family protein [Gammaproteobacteria bacterium]|nr:glutaredoxin family protein [Gammaproteobacteria bacterium]HBF08501.1 glutaredoxin family protein [Gammaproteobacteria bacterium]HCK92820.1 glutaredoxin family protein [Gammaproteobacteria bacterium]|tara:strand:+ start:7769 stop:8515 length:747 start_codon:yes stop_codon:yes gene_type:complete
MAKTAQLYRMHTDEHLCPFGLKSKDLLKHEGYEVEDHELTSRSEADDFKDRHDVKTTPQTFIDGVRIGGYDDLRNYFDKAPAKSQGTTYTPVIAIFATALISAIAFSIGMRETPLSGWTFQTFIALSMILLAVQKLRDLESFSNSFITYDLLGMNQPRYAYVYPFLEAYAGIGMIAALPAWFVAPVSIFIGLVGGISVFKAVYIDKRELKCACVGGDSNVPLGFVSLTENIMMVFAGIWMFVIQSMYY